MNSGFNIRFAAETDAPELLEIYAPYVKETAISFEYAVPSLEVFAGRIRSTLERFPYLVAEKDGEIAGYVYASPFKSREAYDWSVETSIYIRRDRRGHGLGRLLYSALEEKLAAQGICNVNACIAYAAAEDEYLKNDSVRFHEHMGYSMVGCFHKCANKFGRWYDMVWMEKFIGEHRADPPRVKSIKEI